MTQDQKTLFDLGERRILREIIPKFATGAGDDCASVLLASPRMVITTDPVPRPAAEVIGGDTDPFWLGWLLVTINASDVAASGARPEGFLAAVDLPREYPIKDFEHLLKGIQASCDANGLRYVGGNLREAITLAAVGTAFGSSPILPLSRKGAQIGDHIIILGEGGRFWADVFRHRRGDIIDKLSSPMFSPVSQVNVVYRLHEAGLIHCAMDTSDGFAPTLEELALVNDASIEIDISLLRRYSEGFSDIIARAERLWFGWGDWTVVAAVGHEMLPQLKQVMDALIKPWSDVGRIVPGPTGVYLLDGSNKLRAQRLESERFAPDSWFFQGIDEYITRLLSYSLP